MKNHNDTKKPMRRKYNLFFRYMGFSIASVTISFLVLYIIFLLFVSGNWNNDRMEILQSNAMVIAEKTASLMSNDVTEEDSYRARSSGQLRTRFQAFVEALEIKRIQSRKEASA